MMTRIHIPVHLIVVIVIFILQQVHGEHKPGDGATAKKFAQDNLEVLNYFVKFIVI